MTKQLYKISTVSFLFFISFIFIAVAYTYILQKETEFLDKKYTELITNSKKKIDFLIRSKRNATLALTLTFMNNDNIIKILENPETHKVKDLKNISLILRENTDFKNVWFQVIDSRGISLYKSWSENKFDNLGLVREDVKQMIRDPKIQNSISVGYYDMTFKSMVPLFRNSEFIGIIETVTHFNSIAKRLRASEGVEPVILVHKRYKKQLIKPFTNTFINDYYVANLDSNKSLLKFIKDEGVENFLDIKDYKVIGDKLIASHYVIYNRNKLANFIISKDLKDIDISDIKEYKVNAFIYLTIFILLLIFCITTVSYFLYSKELRKLYTELYDNHEQLNSLNSSLKQTIDEEIEKNNKKNQVLFQQSKMAAMGEMLENIAHQWRQPLSVITTAATGIKLQKELGVLSDKDHVKSLDGIVRSAQYLSQTIDDFRDFFNPDKQYYEFQTKELLHKTFKLLETQFSNKNIVIHQDIENVLLYGLENELLQVLVNLLNNSRDELLKSENQKRLIFIEVVRNHDDLVIRIKDNAGGIPASILDRIFEPYFTTKHKSQGTGIGLYMAKEIISKHMKGSIDVTTTRYTYDSIEYIGAEFIIIRPIRL